MGIRQVKVKLFNNNNLIGIFNEYSEARKEIDRAGIKDWEIRMV